MLRADSSVITLTKNNRERLSCAARVPEMKFSGLTDIGRFRSENQDYFLITPLTDTALLAVVCDGMGGAAGGKIASTLAASSFESAVIAGIAERNLDLCDKTDDNLAILEEVLKEAVRIANREVFSYAKDSVDLVGMGTTLVACLVIGNECIICNVGDSRLYHFTSRSMRQITRDHSYVQMLIDTGRLEPQLAAAHPDRNIIMRAVGTRAGVTAETFRLTLSEKESLLLCSDGLYGYASHEVIYSIVWGNEAIFYESEETKVQKLIDAANQGGGRDNITAVLLTY